MSKRLRMGEETTFRLSKDFPALVRAYSQALPGTTLGNKTVTIEDPLWVATMSDGCVVSCGPCGTVDPHTFNRVSVFHSHPWGAQTRVDSSRVAVPVEAYHHKFHHSVDMSGHKNNDDVCISGMDQQALRNIMEFWCLVDRDELQEVLTKIRDRIARKKDPKVRSLVRGLRLAPPIKTITVYAYA